MFGPLESPILLMLQGIQYLVSSMLIQVQSYKHLIAHVVQMTNVESAAQ